MRNYKWVNAIGFIFFIFFALSISLISITTVDAADSKEADTHDHGQDDHGHSSHHGIDGSKLPLWTIIPFAGILLSIAGFPLVAEHFWHQNYGKVSLAWIGIFSIPFLIGYRGDAWYEIVHIVLLDYVPFIVLLSSVDMTRQKLEYY